MSKIGRFGEFGGQYIPETVMTAVHELEKAYDKYKDDPEFNKELQELYHNYAGRPSMLYYAEKINYVSYTEITQTVHLFYITQRR